MALAGSSPAQVTKTAKTVSRSLVVLGQDKLPPETEPAPKLTVGDCIRISHEKQPKLAALRASVGSAQAGERGLEGARWLGHFSPDYKFRRQQAATGVLAASAELEQAEHEVTQAVVWNYYSVVYAREQLKVASEAVNFVDHYREQVEEIVKSKKGDREINQLTLNKLIARLGEGELLLLEAKAGHLKARAALREAMGVDCEYRFEVADETLPNFGAIDIKRDIVIGHAKTRRGEIIMAGLVGEVTRLEAFVQWSLRFRYRTQTFASGADIHSRSIPHGSKDGDYRPDAIGPEMPSNLFGPRKERTAKAWELAARSQAVLEKTTNLVVLEAENAFIDFSTAGESMATAKRIADAGKASVVALRDVAGDRVSSAASLQSLLEAHGDSARGQAAFNKVVYQRIVALANIERITAGGIKIKYPGRPTGEASSK